MYCNYLNKACLALLFPHQTPHTEYHICTLTYTRWQRDIKASVRLGERTSWTCDCHGPHPSCPPPRVSTDSSSTAGTTLRAGPTGWWDCNHVSAPAHCCLQGKRLTLSVKNAECSFPDFGENTVILEWIFWWFFLNVHSGMWQNASLSLPGARWLIPVTPHTSRRAGALCLTPTPASTGQDPSATHCPQPRSLLQVLTHFPAELGILLSEVSPEPTGTFTPCTCPWKFTGSRSEPSSSAKCPVVPPAHLWQKDMSLNWPASATFLWQLTGNVFLTQRVYIFAFHALKYTDL